MQLCARVRAGLREERASRWRRPGPKPAGRAGSPETRAGVAVRVRTELPLRRGPQPPLSGRSADRTRRAPIGAGGLLPSELTDLTAPASEHTSGRPALARLTRGHTSESLHCACRPVVSAVSAVLPGVLRATFVSLRMSFRPPPALGPVEVGGRGPEACRSVCHPAGGHSYGHHVGPWCHCGALLCSRLSWNFREGAS